MIQWIGMASSGTLSRTNAAAPSQIVLALANKRAKKQCRKGIEDKGVLLLAYHTLAAALCCRVHGEGCDGSDVDAAADGVIFGARKIVTACDNA
jgi:hypothetical protein